MNHLYIIPNQNGTAINYFDVLNQTEKAIQVKMNDSKKSFALWIPKSALIQSTYSNETKFIAPWFLKKLNTYQMNALGL